MPLSQRVGLRLGREAVSRHRDSRRRLEPSVDDWSERDDAVRGDRARPRLERHMAGGTGRLLSRRRGAERTREPALVSDEGARLADARTLVLPGGLRLAALEPCAIPEGRTLTGAVQIVDVTMASDAAYQAAPPALRGDALAARGHIPGPSGRSALAVAPRGHARTQAPTVG